MNKDQLAQELKQKVKPGIKPSDLKKSKNTNGEKALGSSNSSPFIFPSHQTNSPLTPPDSPIIIPIDKKTGKKPGQEGILPPSIVQGESKKINQLQAQVNY